jgi:hypothetical protein
LIFGIFGGPFAANSLYYKYLQQIDGLPGIPILHDTPQRDRFSDADALENSR